ncbi:ABC transporter substrate-binding protein [Allopusillimonas ginsengisoli]|nr:ABC transporter substrate-binding protein [Allopusillimonas ginsengisoli]
MLVLAIAFCMLSMTFTSMSKAQTITAVMQTGLRILDPVLTTNYTTRNYGYMVYDTLLSVDADYKIQPQMVEKWTESADKKTYTFTLRGGLKWSDGTSVTAEDCVASIKRWAQLDTTGQVLMTMLEEIRILDDKTFEVILKEPTGLLLEGLSKLSSRPCFMMPKHIAETPASEPISASIGSGPFKFVASEFKPGLKVVFERNEHYVPRSEPPSWTAGGKVVNVDRVVWVSMPDQMTAVNALLSGEIDYMELVPYDLLPMLESNEDIKVEVLDELGQWAQYRFNFLYPPFNNKQIRQAAMYAVGQESAMKAAVGNSKYYETCAAVFGCGTRYASSYGSDIVVSPDVEKAKKLLAQAGYDGTPVVILNPTDNAVLSALPVVVAAGLRKAGFNVKLKPMDWQTFAVARNSKKPVEDGGWNVIPGASSLVASSDPFSATVAGSGAKAWAGWPDVPEIEALKLEFARAIDPEERKRIAEEVQKLVIDNGVIIPLGQYVAAAAYSKTLTGLLHSPITTFWNVQKPVK